MQLITFEDSNFKVDVDCETEVFKVTDKEKNTEVEKNLGDRLRRR